MRLDRALAADLGTALHSRPLQAYLLFQLLAGGVFVWRRGLDTVSTVLLVWVGLLLLAFVAWWAGRQSRAVPGPDPVAAAGPRAALAVCAAVGLTLWGIGSPTGPVARAGFVLTACGLGGWAWAAWRAGGERHLRERLTRDWRPFVPLLLLVGLPRLLAGGPAYLLGATLALPSGIGQQLLYLVGLFAPLEASSRRPAAAAVVAALLFGLVHVPFNLPDNAGDTAAAVANGLLFQANVGLVAVLAYRRHRAVVPIGAAHALAIG